MEKYQFLGWIACAMYLLAPLFKTPRNTIKTSLFGECCNALFYAISMQWAGALSMGLNIVRGTCAVYASDQVLKYVAYFSLALIWGATLYKLSFPYDILIASAATCIALSQKNRDKFYTYRGFVMLSQVLWIIHSYFTGMHTMLVTCILILTMHTVTVIYFTFKTLKNRQLETTPLH